MAGGRAVARGHPCSPLFWRHLPFSHCIRAGKRRDGLFGVSVGQTRFPRGHWPLIAASVPPVLNTSKESHVPVFSLSPTLPFCLSLSIPASLLLLFPPSLHLSRARFCSDHHSQPPVLLCGHGGCSEGEWGPIVGLTAGKRMTCVAGQARVPVDWQQQQADTACGLNVDGFPCCRQLAPWSGSVLLACSMLNAECFRRAACHVGCTS